MRQLKTREEIDQLLGKLDFESATERNGYNKWYTELTEKEKKYLKTKLRADKFAKRNRDLYK